MVLVTEPAQSLICVHGTQGRSASNRYPRTFLCLMSHTEHHGKLVAGSKLCDFILKNKATDAVEARISNKADQLSDLL